MNSSLAFHGAIWCAAALAAGTASSQAQVTITSADMFNQVGQYYLAYANANGNNVIVPSSLGATGGPQTWDFTTGPQDVTYRFDYLAASNTPYGADFVSAGAQIAEQKTDEGNTNDQSWLYYTQDATKGRIDYGFYDPTFSADQPESVFTNGLQDFPASISFGSSWQGTTVFYTMYNLSGVGDFPAQLTYTSVDTVNAYGTVVLPSIGSLSCVVVHELVRYDVAFDLGLGGGYEPFGSQYVLNYYWLAPGHGIAAQITSNTPSDGSEPPDNMGGLAAAMVRMFSASHSVATPAIRGFGVLPSTKGAMLQWTVAAGVSSYTIQYTTSLVSPINWQTLASTTTNALLDATATAAAPGRYYRVVGILGAK